MVESTPVIQLGGWRLRSVSSQWAPPERKRLTNEIWLARHSPRPVVDSTVKKCCYPLRLLKLLLWLGRAKGVFSSARVLMIT